MADQFKLDDDGNCPSCDQLSAQGEHVECYSCNRLFHAVCTTATEKIATKTTIQHFLQPSTKKNFVFFCDRCLTEMEISKETTDAKRLDALEGQMSGVDKKLNEIMTALIKRNDTAAVKKTSSVPKDNIWSDKERLANVKAPEPKAVLVINKSADPEKNVKNQEEVERIIVNNAISLAETHKNKNGDLVLVCQSEGVRNELRNLVETSNDDIQMNSPKTKQHSVTIVGLSKEVSKEELMNMISLNEYIKTFGIRNKLEDHIKIHIIKPLRNKPTVFQAFVSVSPILRKGIGEHNDKIVIGVTSCKVYDRKQTKRCNNCQKYGHFANHCPNPTTPHCGKCSEKHRTDQCNSEERKCINCVRNLYAETDHPVFYHKCPALVKHLQEIQNGLNLKLKENHQGT